MNTISFTYEGVNYVRINRTKALKFFKAGYPLAVFGRMDNPLSPWSGQSMWVYSPKYSDFGITPDDAFIKLENSFEFYRCKKPWWYIPENLLNNIK